MNVSSKHAEINPISSQVARSYLKLLLMVQLDLDCFKYNFAISGVLLGGTQTVTI